MYLLGIDLGSSSVKASIVKRDDGIHIASAHQPKIEMSMLSPEAGWAEQDPEMWWRYTKLSILEAIQKADINPKEIASIGISYQMHGLVLIDNADEVIRPSIIWCDSRAVEIGQHAFNEIGSQKVLSSLLNSPGNFTASKLKWVQLHEAELYDKTKHILFPGDFIAMCLTGEVNTTVPGLSEGIFWDFKEEGLSDFLLEYFKFDRSLIPPLVPTFGVQGYLLQSIADEMGLSPGIPIAYRAGDQPNNGFSLNVLQPGEIAATAGTSGVIYGVTDKCLYDEYSRVNTFAHVNHRKDEKRLGVLLCVNGTGILNSWLRKNIGRGTLTYNEMNELAEKVPIGADGLTVLPFGNGAERIFENKNIGAHIENLDFNRHTDGHVLRAAQEGIAFSLKYGLDIMEEMDLPPSKIRAGMANLFLSPIFRETLAGVSGLSIEMYNTDGGQGAALGGGLGAGLFTSFEEAFQNLSCIQRVEPDPNSSRHYKDAYAIWRSNLEKKLANFT